MKHDTVPSPSYPPPTTAFDRKTNSAPALEENETETSATDKCEEKHTFTLVGEFLQCRSERDGEPYLQGLIPVRNITNIGQDLFDDGTNVVHIWFLRGPGLNEEYLIQFNDVKFDDLTDALENWRQGQTNHFY